MIDQRAYPDVMLNNTKYSVATDGCYFSALLHGLQLRGYNFSVSKFNQYMIENHAFYKDTAMISASLLPQRLPNIFLEGRNEAWNDGLLLTYLENREYIVIGEVDGKAIGGSGQHFVYIDRVDATNRGTISMTYIDDSYGGLEDQKVTTRYNGFGNILSLRVFKVKLPSQNQGGGDMANMYKGLDLSNQESMKVAVDVWDRVQKGEFVEKTLHEQALAAQKQQLEKEKSIAETKAYERGVQDGRAQSPVQPVPPSDVDTSQWEENGLQVEILVGNTKIIKNYKKK